MLAPLRPPTGGALRLRALHTSTPLRNRIGPPDPISNLRPILYDDPPPTTPPAEPRHPYSLSEFRGDVREYQWKLQRQQLDEYNHAFWTDSNARFESAKAAVLSSLPPSCTLAQHDLALSDFYKHWVQQESKRQEEYTREWRLRSFEEIKLALRIHYQKFMARITPRAAPIP
ncbi:hypothetical protein EW146_g3081 [Bondarzewia mesenterica]|uniref:Apoptogenic protein 1, mitochondrial n=1 Tax=Bondarzewia mesenterica TaxID=1095465 RepID=A0A4S4LYT8_9AGAM|nr:hypothetical protein EW146_g3081 [Bondarzewia mesenterica]